MVIYPIGSGKSLCFQFPPVYDNKKGIVITTTISLMQDQVQKLGISSVYSGSAQFDRNMEKHALEPDSKHALIFVTPERVTEPCNLLKLQSLAQSGRLRLLSMKLTSVPNGQTLEVHIKISRNLSTIFRTHLSWC